MLPLNYLSILILWILFQYLCQKTFFSLIFETNLFILLYTLILVDGLSYFLFRFLIRFLYTLFSLIYASFSTFASFNSSFLCFEVQDFWNGQLFNWFFNIEACFFLIRLRLNYCSLTSFWEANHTCAHSSSRRCLRTTIAMFIILLWIFLFKTA